MSRYLEETSVSKHTCCKRYLRIKGFWDEESAHKYLHSDTLDIKYASEKETYYNKLFKQAVSGAMMISEKEHAKFQKTLIVQRSLIPCIVPLSLQDKI